MSHNTELKCLFVLIGLVIAPILIRDVYMGGGIHFSTPPPTHIPHEHSILHNIYPCIWVDPKTSLTVSLSRFLDMPHCIASVKFPMKNILHDVYRVSETDMLMIQVIPPLNTSFYVGYRWSKNYELIIFGWVKSYV